jgi:hypothetical protein
MRVGKGNGGVCWEVEQGVRRGNTELDGRCQCG